MALVTSIALSAFPLSSTAGSFGGLAVTGLGWRFFELPLDANFSSQLFQVIGDADGDGYDDAVAWTNFNASDQRIYRVPFLIRGSPDGPIPAETTMGANCLQSAPACQRYAFDAGASPALDSRPLGIDVDDNGSADAIALYGSNLAICPAISPTTCGIPQPTLFYGGVPPLPANGSKWFWPQQSNEPRAAGYLLPAISSNGTAPALFEQVAGRGTNSTAPAVTRFSVRYNLGPGPDAGPNALGVTVIRSWNATEPTPLSIDARPPRFVAAPDFDLDGLADLVTWSPPGTSTSGPLSGWATLYNGTPDGPHSADPTRLAVADPNILVGDFSGDGHPDLASYRLVSPQPGGPATPTVQVAVLVWTASGFQRVPAFNLAGPSIFSSQPPPRLQAADIDGNGLADFVALKYDTTSASAGHLLVDVFFGELRVPCDTDQDAPCTDWSLAFSSEVSLSGADIYTTDAGLRLNLQGDFDGDGYRDITVGYYGGNAPERGRTSESGFVAVLPGETVVRERYKIWIDREVGGVVLPGCEVYTVHLSGWHSHGDTPTLRIEFTGLEAALTNGSSPVYFDIAQDGSAVSSSRPGDLIVAGNASIGHADGIGGPIWSATLPIRFNWSLAVNASATPEAGSFGLTAFFVDASTADRAVNPVAARLVSSARLIGDVRVDSAARQVEPGGWVRASAPVEFSGLRLAYDSVPTKEVCGVDYRWLLHDGAKGIDWQTPLGPAAALLASFPPLNVTVRDIDLSISVDGLAGVHLRAPVHFPFSADADAPQFGEHLPLESEWVTTSPAFIAVQIFDNESGVDLDRIEYSWADEGAPFVDWNDATALPGQSPAEVAAQAWLSLPEGTRSRVMWRVWDKVGNGPAESPIFNVSVDTATLTFQNPRPTASQWQDSQSVVASVEILAGSSGVFRESVEYRVSTGGLFEFGPWTQAPTLSSPLDTPFRATTAVSLQEGSANWIQWRADNNALVGLRQSDPFQIRVDSKLPVIDSLAPNETALFPRGVVPLFVSAHDGSPQDVPQRGLLAEDGGALYRVKGPADLDFGSPVAMHVLEAGPAGWSASFGANVPFERGTSTVEFSVREAGGRTVTTLTTVRVNQLPTVTVESAPANFSVELGGNLTVRANATDPDGQPLRYAWAACGPLPTRPPAPPRPSPPFSDNATLELTAESPASFNTSTLGSFPLCLVVRDPLDGEVRVNLTVQVLAGPPGPPPTQPPGGPPEGSPPVVTELVPEAGFATIALLVAAAFAALAVLLRRRSRPPDNF